MELDKLKSTWKNIKVPPEEVNSMEHDAIIKKVKRKYWKNILKIAVPEFLLIILYLYGVVFFIVFQGLLNNSFQKIMANLAIIILIVVPVISLYSLYKFYVIGKVHGSPNSTLMQLKKQGLFFTRIRYVSLGLNILLFSLILVTVPTIYSEKLTRNEMSIAFVIGSFLLIVLSKLIWNYYISQIRKNEQALYDLEQE